MSVRSLIITLLLFFITPNIYSQTNVNLLNNKIIINVSNSVIEDPYYISIKYNDTDLTQNTSIEDTISLNDENYKLTETTTTKPFYININQALIENDIRFEITIQAGEFIGLDYNNNINKSGITPFINTYGDYEYSFENNVFNNNINIIAYLSKGLVEAQHLAAFTFSWPAAQQISSGSYTSTNTIIIKSEISSIPVSN